MEQILGSIVYPLVVAAITSLFFMLRESHKNTVTNRERSREDRRKFISLVILFDRFLSSVNDMDSTFNSRSVQSELRHQHPFLRDGDYDDTRGTEELRKGTD